MKRWHESVPSGAGLQTALSFFATIMHVPLPQAAWGAHKMTKTTTSAYPTLAEMGVESPKQIAGYHISSLNLVDVLRVTYERPKGSILPSSRTYKFPRVQDSAPSGGRQESVFMKTHPKLRAALEELQSILEAKTRKESIAEEILNEIALLEEDIAMRTECLKVLVSKIPAAD
jgi:hypothetical protein